MKQLKFLPELIAPILSGQKYVTWRLFDDKDLTEGDELEFLNSKTKESFAKAKIVSVREKRIGDLNEQDFVGHEILNETPVEHYRKLYNCDVTADTTVKIIEFKLI